MGEKKTNVSRKLRVTVTAYKEQAPKLNIADDPWRFRQARSRNSWTSRLFAKRLKKDRKPKQAHLG